ncbi:MAG: ABC transporter ATP-binding protein [Spirochaetales bacterium]|jgi:ATP-binding cassette, subfamily B, bacterial|nr:ABC transporter ATP-binding protein [Spirochaetales bacterium]
MKQDLKRAINLLGKNKIGYIVLVLFASLPGATVNILFSYTMKLIIDFFVYRNREILSQALISTTATILIGAIGLPLSNYLLNRKVEAIMKDIRIRIFRFLQKLPVSYFERKHSGDMLSMINKDTESYRSFLNTISQFTGSIFSIGLLIPYLLILDWRFGLIAFGMGFVTAFVNIKFVFPMRERSKEIHKKTAVLAEEITENVTGFGVIKMYALKARFLERYQAKMDALLKEQKLFVRLEAYLYSANGLIGWINSGGLSVLGCLFVLRGTMTPGTLVGTVFIAGNLTWGMSSLSGTITAVQKAFAGTDRLFELFQEAVEPERYETPGAAVESGIAFSKALFSYSDNMPTLEELNIRVPKGKTAALVGDSGGGKSTIIKLLLGQYKLSDGGMSLEGKAANSFSLEELRDLMAYVPQDAYVFNGTIRENIAYGRPGADNDEIVEAAKKANAHDFIREQPNGYDTLVGERGIRLSGGQRQRVAIARAVLKNAPILLLDEATSSLDSESELLVQNALEELMRDKTSVVVAHRLSTVEHADIIYVIESGRVTDQGTHGELISRQGKYRELYYQDFT